MRIREATTADAEAIADLQIRAWRAAYREVLSPQQREALTVEGVLPNLRWSLEHRPDYWRLWVAEGDGVIVGFASTTPSTDTDARTADRVAELSAIYVDPERLRRGIGSALLAHVLADLAERASRVTLWVLETNTAARSFFEARGWEADGSRTVDLVGEQLLPVVRYRRAP